MNSEQKEVIKKNFVALVGGLDVTESFLSYFIPDNFLIEDNVESMLLPTKTKKNRAIEFLRTIQKKGSSAFDVFYDAAVGTQQYDVADLLKPHLAPSRPQPTSRPHRSPSPPSGNNEPRPGGSSGGNGQPEEVDSAEFSDDDSYLDHTRDDLDQIRLRLTPTISNLKGLFSSSKVYPMSKTRGRCLIINNNYFSMKMAADQVTLDHRDGSQQDVKNIHQVFKDLNFDLDPVHAHDDLTVQEMLDLIKLETSKPVHSAYDMFTLVLMSHGTTNAIYGADNRPLQYTEIFDALSYQRFPAMAGKPKLVIIQACAGGLTDVASGYTTDSAGPQISQDARPPPAQAEPVLPQPDNLQHAGGKHLLRDDLFVMNASFTSFVSNRHKRQGTWFIRALVEALYKHSCRTDIVGIFQQVKKKVRNKSLAVQSQDRSVSGQIPVATDTLTKKLYLFPKYDP